MKISPKDNGTGSGDRLIKILRHDDAIVQLQPGTNNSDFVFVAQHTAIMVRVWYEPPPFGPGTDLNRQAYGIGGGGLLKGWNQKLMRMPQPMLMAGGVVAAMVISYIPMRKSIVSRLMINKWKRSIRRKKSCETDLQMIEATCSSRLSIVAVIRKYRFCIV